MNMAVCVGAGQDVMQDVRLAPVTGANQFTCQSTPLLIILFRLQFWLEQVEDFAAMTS